ncbi:aminotransferase-like domain-containing protein [Amantichitinum ursilacus]|uniref:Putative 8-amino-7-oxononanoate synthase n=1 Tax=Amantichitinum ursilacus TaxID=857265 RepID=A0A0N0GNF0_9NEIS|nr:PLP-dependent aminotransferase family protein [Amantichitinum ursilacus]KPC52712.1 putative HTH-type transcriptional regulator YdcR [Amantichitinum ursilacus]
MVTQIVEQLTEAIQRGDLAQGARLQPVREMALQLGVSKSTVIEALDRLRAKGLIVSRQGAGHAVARNQIKAPGLGRDLLPQDTLSVLRRSLITETGKLRPGCGFLPLDWLPEDALLKAMRGAIRANTLRLSECGAAAGYLPLRHALQIKLAAVGIDVPVEQIVTASSTMNAVDMVLRLLLQPGDKVLLDDPCYFNFHAMLAYRDASAITIKRTPQGIDFAELEHTLMTHRPRVYITNSVLHNPLGHSFSPVEAFRLADLARRYQVHIIEDDLYCDIQMQPTPRLAVAGGLEHVSYISGFTKTLTPNTRASFIVATPALSAQLTALKLSTGGITSELTEQIIYRILSEGSYGRHIARLTDRLFESGQNVAQWLQQAGCEVQSTTGEGFFLWVRLPQELDAIVIARHALAEGMALAPGGLFSRDPAANQFLRFNVAHSDDARVKSLFLRALTLR